MEDQPTITQTPLGNNIQPNLQAPIHIPIWQKIPKIFLIGGVILIVLTVVLLIFLFSSGTAKKTQPQASSSPKIPPQVTLTGLEIAKKTAEFLDKSTNEDGSFQLKYACDKKIKVGCVIQSEEGPSGQIIVAYLELAKATNIESYRQKADKAMNFYLNLCLKDTVACERNITALYAYYKETDDERYKNAILSRADAIFPDQPLGSRLGRDIGDKLIILYELTGDKKYLDKLEVIANQFLAGEFVPPKEQLAYKVNSLEVNAADPAIMAYIYLPAYNLTKNPTVKMALDNFFTQGDFSSHLNDFKKLGNNMPLMILMDALFEYAPISDNPQKYLDEAQKIASEMVLNAWDSKENKKFAGDYGFLHAFRTDTNNKFTVNSGWLALLYLKMADQKFTID